MHKLVDVGPSESDELVRFIATAQSCRPQAWGYVERLKAACAQTPGSNPELRDLLQRVWRLEHEIESLRAQSLTLQAQLARRVSPAEWPAALDELDAGIERATRLSSQLLQLARLEPNARQPILGPVQLDAS